MAQTNPNRGGCLERFTFRTIASIVGLLGTVLALLINILFSLTHVLGRASGMTTNPSHFWWGIVVVIVAFIGTCLAPFFAIPAAILLLATGIAFFFIVGWWAVIASVFLFLAAILCFSNRRAREANVA